MYINFICPPLPHLVTGGKAIFRQGDTHVKRTLKEVFDLIVVVKGSLFIEENNLKYTINKGQFLILPPQRLHRGFKCCEAETIFYWLHFAATDNFIYSEKLNYKNQLKKRLTYSERKENFYISLQQYGSLTPQQEQEITLCMQSIVDICVDKRFNKHDSRPYSISQIKRQQLFFTILTILCELQPNDIKANLATDVYEYLLQFYKKPFDLKLLSKKFAFHPTYIIRCVKNKFGKTPLQLLLVIRIDKAKKLLQTTNYTINKIGFDVGFEDNAYFTKQFKRITNMTPSDYRRQAKLKIKS